MNDDEIERAKETVANRFGALWVIHGEKVSEQLDQSLNEQISYDIDSDIWLEIIGKLNQHPKLAEYVRQRVFSGVPSQTYSNERLSSKASLEEQLRWAWKEFKGTTKSIETICEDANLGNGIQAILRAAEFEEDLLRRALGLLVDYRSDPTETSMLERCIADCYDSLATNEKWSLMPLFFNEDMTKRDSRFLTDHDANEVFFKIFQKRLRADGLTISELKNQFLESGFGDLMPCLHLCDPDAWSLGRNQEEAEIPSTEKREPFIDDKNLDQVLKGKSYSKKQNEGLSVTMERQNDSTDESQVFCYNFWTHEPEEGRIWIKSTDSTGEISLKLQYDYFTDQLSFADISNSSYLESTDPLDVKISVWKNLLEIFTNTSSLTFGSQVDDNEETNWEYYSAKLPDSWEFVDALKVGDTLIVSFDNLDEHQFGLAGLEETMREVEASYGRKD